MALKEQLNFHFGTLLLLLLFCQAKLVISQEVGHAPNSKSLLLPIYCVFSLFLFIDKTVWLRFQYFNAIILLYLLYWIYFFVNYDFFCSYLPSCIQEFSKTVPLMMCVTTQGLSSTYVRNRKNWGITSLVTKLIWYFILLHLWPN